MTTIYICLSVFNQAFSLMELCGNEATRVSTASSHWFRAIMMGQVVVVVLYSTSWNDGGADFVVVRWTE